MARSSIRHGDGAKDGDPTCGTRGTANTPPTAPRRRGWARAHAPGLARPRKRMHAASASLRGRWHGLARPSPPPDPMTRTRAPHVRLGRPRRRCRDGPFLARLGVATPSSPRSPPLRTTRQLDDHGDDGRRRRIAEALLGSPLHGMGAGRSRGSTGAPGAALGDEIGGPRRHVACQAVGRLLLLPRARRRATRPRADGPGPLAGRTPTSSSSTVRATRERWSRMLRMAQVNRPIRHRPGSGRADLVAAARDQGPAARSTSTAADRGRRPTSARPGGRPGQFRRRNCSRRRREATVSP